jgi:hypothetical protein
VQSYATVQRSFADKHEFYDTRTFAIPSICQSEERRTTGYFRQRNVVVYKPIYCQSSSLLMLSISSPSLHLLCSWPKLTCVKELHSSNYSAFIVDYCSWCQYS